MQGVLESCLLPPSSTGAQFTHLNRPPSPSLAPSPSPSLSRATLLVYNGHAKPNRRWCRRAVPLCQEEGPFPSTPDSLSQWESSREPLLSLGYTSPEVDTLLKKAFGWTHSPYWGEEREEALPDSESLSETLTYLRQLGLSDSDLAKVLKKFPEVLGCHLEEEIKANVALLDQNWGISGNMLKNLILRNPKVLGYVLDCKGDCKALCTRCWARF